MTNDIDEPGFARTAERFAEALVRGEFEFAYSSLDSDARAEWPADALRDSFAAMVGYFATPADQAELIETMTDWPGKRPGDLGWAYVAITGGSQSEAVTVIVRDERGAGRIRAIDWGRP